MAKRARVEDRLDVTTAGPLLPEQRTGLTLVGPASSPDEVQEALAGTSGAGVAWRWESRLRAALLATDLAALLLAVGLGVLARPDYPVGFGLALVPAWLLVLAACGCYDSRHVLAGSTSVRRVADASLRLGLAVGFASYLLPGDPLRDVVLVTLPAGGLLLLTGRTAGHLVLLSLRRRARCHQRVLAVGTVLDVLHLVQQARRHPTAGFHITVACVPSYDGTDRRRRDRRDRRGLSRTELDRQRAGDRRAENDRRAMVEELTELGVTVVGQPHQVLEAVRRTGADTVAVAGHGVLSRHALRRLAWQLEGTRVRLFVASALTEVAAPRITLRPLGGLPLLQVEAPAFSGIRRVLKAALDRLLAAAIVAALSPVLLVLALLIRLDDRGPVLYHQERIGLGGRPFRCLKLRTMRVGADREVAALAEQTDGNGVLFKMRADPRVTRVGRLLRRLSLDELPQLFNVLGGSMSLVGPRPPLPSEVEEYGDDVRRRLLVKPGMTGLWQVSGRSDLSWADSVRLDLYYVENWSPYLDFALMARTVRAVVAGRGAY